MEGLVLYLCSAVASLGLGNYQQKRACRYMPTIVKEAKRNDIDPKVLIGLIFAESSFNYWVVSKAGACGLTQVIPKYTGKYSPVKKYTCDQLKNPYTSIRVGAKIFKWWVDYHEKKLPKKRRAKMSPNSIKMYSVTRGLCGYNAGFRCKDPRPSRGGMRYAKKVLKAAKTIEKKLSAK